MFFGSVDAYMSISKRATRVNREKKSEVEHKNLMDEHYGSSKAFDDPTVEHAELRELADTGKQSVDAKVRKTREDHARKLDVLCFLFFKASKSELMQQLDKWHVKR